MKEQSKENKRKRHGDFSKFIKKKKHEKLYDKDEKSSKKRKFRDETGNSDIRGRRSKGKSQLTGKIKNNIDKNDSLIRLNKFIANSGICSRREADKLIQIGAISVNGKIITELGTKISPTDKVQYGGETLSTEKPVYILLNKPKGYITTTDDPYERKTVMILVEKACKERIFPVGRLDRNTTGVLLFTNDGKLAKTLTHPKHEIKKIYHVVLNKPLTTTDIKTVATGIELEDGLIKVDKIAYIEDGTDKTQIGIEIHSGRNRIVRRIFESLNYKVVRLDRVTFAGLTKKDTPRGKWRFLKDYEINILKMIS
jgi:23S rRNA pseudouridine2605 synthase